MERVLVSACLLGQAVRYHGGDARCDSDILASWVDEGRVVPLCPEVAGGLPVPRAPAEIVSRPSGGPRVVTEAGTDVTEAFLTGARTALRLCEEHSIRLAVLKENSPSCGVSRTYDGSFSATLKPGAGITAKMLANHQVRVFSEHELAEALRYLRALESRAST